jgi:hypothetical protein
MLNADLTTLPKRDGQREKLMNTPSIWRLKTAALLTMFALAALSLADCGQKAQTPGSDESKADAKSETSKEDAKIQSAMSAARMAIAKDAAIVDYPAKAGQPLIEIRKGTNGWTCFPDWEASPGNDPQCLDETWMQWTEAYMSGTEPKITSTGIAYMLQGGSDASNTDPFAMKPPKGEEWLSTGPHIMVLAPGKGDTARFSTDHHSGGPWVMWAGTPYEHLMVPMEETTK